MRTNDLIYVFAVFCLLVSGPFLSAGNDGKCVQVKNLDEKDLVFKGGERLVFSVHYKWGVVNADVAKATVKLDTTFLNGVKVFHSSLYGKTQKLYDSFFKVSENLQSWFTTDGLKPMQFTRAAREGSYTCTDFYSYDWTPGNEHIKAALNTSRKGSYSAELKLEKCTVDIPTMFYTLRNLDFSQLKAGVLYPMTFAVDDDVYTLHFIYLGKENKYIPGTGTVRCLKLGFQVVSGEVFSGDSDLYAWFSDDENKIPVWFIAPLRIGQVQGRLSSYSGLKHPFSSIVN